MPKVSFSLKKNTPGEVTSIQLILTCSDGRLKYYTGESVDPADFPDNLNKGTRAVLNRIESHTDQLIVDSKVTGQPLTKQAVKSGLDMLLNKKRVQEPGNVFDTWTRIVDDMEVGRRLTPGKKRYSKLSIKTFRFTITMLQEFNPNLSAVSMDTYHRFIRWMQDQDYSINYIGSQLKNWKSLGRIAGGAIYSDPGFKKIQEQTHDVYLDEKELSKIYKLKLSDREDVVRDWFIIDCYTGLRVSDLVLLSKKNYSDGMITIANEKTDERVVIPAHPFVKEIMKKWKGFPRAVTDVEINRVIKKVAEKAGITSEVLFTITKGGQRKDEYLKKWQMVSCHTSRRSFITNLLKAGVPDVMVMKLTGMKSHLTLKKYNKVSIEEVAKIMGKHRFFK